MLQITCTGFFFILQAFTCSTSYFSISTYSRLTSYPGCISIIHTNSQENQSWRQIYLKLFWHITKPKAICPAMVHGLSSHCLCSLQLSGAFRAKNFHCSTHSTEWTEGDISSSYSCTSLLLGLSGGCSLHEKNISRFKNWSWRLSLNFGMIISSALTDGREPDPWANSCWVAVTVCATRVLCCGPGTEHPVQDTAFCTAQQ